MNTNIPYGIGFKIPYDTDNADINSIIDYVKNHESTIRSRTDNFSKQFCAAVDAKKRQPISNSGKHSKPESRLP